VVGGRSRELKLGDYSFDTGPTFLHQKFVLDEMFQETGRNAEDYIDFVKLDPMTRLTWGDKSMHTYADETKMGEELERVFPGSRDGYHRFMRHHADKLRKLYPVLQRPYGSLSSFLSPDLVKALPYVATKSSVFDVLGNYFDDERLRLAFTFQAKYLGMSPWEWVDEILYTNKNMNGVKLKSGEVIKSDDVIVNADFAHAMTTLLNGSSIPREKIRKKKFSCSTFMLYLGVDKLYKEEPFHHVLFADDYTANVKDIQSEKRVSDDMSVYIRNSSICDPNVAPEGHSALYMLVQTINHRHGHDWESTQKEYRDKVIRRVEQNTTMTDLSDHIVEEAIYTPSTWEKSGVFMGATFNLSHHLDQMLYMRPHNAYQGFDNCYLVGGGTHPGSGLPTIYESARISTNLICDRYDIAYDKVDLATDLLAAK